MSDDFKICQVTVYSDRALITRRGTVKLTGEQQEIAIAGLPLTILTDSIAAKCTASFPVKLLAIRGERIFATEAFEQRLMQLQLRIRQLEEQKRSLEDRIASLELQSNFIQGISDNSVERFSSNLVSERVNLTEIKELLNFLGEHHYKYAQNIAECERQHGDLDKRLELLRQQLKQLQQPVYKQSHSNVNITLTVESSEPGDGELEIYYLVNQANWTPVYDLKVSSDRNSIGLNYLAEIKQKTGEDWVGIPVTVSTEKPNTNTQLVKIEPWYITGSKIQVSESQYLSDNDDDFAELEALLAQENNNSKKAELLQEKKSSAQTTKNQSAIAFHLDGNINIPSDGTPQKVTIFNGDFPCRTQYVAIPRLIGNAYIEATITNKSNTLTLLPGKANIFLDNSPFSFTNLENIAPHQEFKINLGSDRSLEIERHLVEREIQIIGKYRRTTYTYKVLIRNLRNKKTKLRLIEQLPVSRDEQIKVHLLDSSPEICLGKMGELEWLITLPAQSKRQAKREIYYQFTVEHPSEITVESLDI